jgi:hypothetical protein
MLALLTFLLGSSIASAQDGGDVTRATERFISDLDRSGQVDYALRSAAVRFHDASRVGSPTAGTAYQELRRTLHARALSDDVLDSWDRVVVAFQRSAGSRPRPGTGHGHGHGGRWGGHASRGVYFQGSFEATPVSLYAADADSLRRECLAYVDRVQPSYVDDVDVFGTRYRNGPSYWNRDQLCNLAAANARSLSPSSRAVTIEGTIEETPFHFEGSPIEVLNAIRTIVPGLVGRDNIDDVVVNGRPHHNGPSFWRPEEVAALIEQGLGPVAYY